MARRHGRARRGQRLVAAVPHGHWKTTTLVAALRHDRITAPCVFDGAINGERFLAWVEQGLAPTLRRGDLVIMDNLPAHKVQGVREAVQARRARLLYLPPYSPDLNPIEQVFAKLKTLLRTAAKRTVDALWHAIGQALDAFSPSECNNYLAHAGYVPSQVSDDTRRGKLKGVNFGQRSVPKFGVGDVCPHRRYERPDTLPSHGVADERIAHHHHLAGLQFDIVDLKGRADDGGPDLIVQKDDLAVRGRAYSHVQPRCHAHGHAGSPKCVTLRPYGAGTGLEARDRATISLADRNPSGA